MGSSDKMLGLCSVQALPEEMLIRIFSYLDHYDLFNVAYVCKYWKVLGDLPWLWNKEEVVLGKLQVENISVLNSRRLKHVTRVSLSPKHRLNNSEAEFVFTQILDH